MATKSYSKHKEYKEFKSSGNVPFTDEAFDMLKTDLVPKTKLDSLARNGTGGREYHYEYKEEKHPSGKYDRKDLHTVEEYTIPPKTVPKVSESSSYYYEREERELPSVNSSTASRTYNYDSSANSTLGYSKVKSSKATKDLSHNVEELDSLLDDLQKDQERQLYKSGYMSDTAESSSFDYRKESRVVPSQVSPAVPQTVPAPQCAHCHHSVSSTGTLTRSSTPMNKVTTTVKTYTYEVPADVDPAVAPLPALPTHQHTYTSDQYKELSTSRHVSPAAPAPVPVGGCQYCSHCETRLSSRTVAAPPPPTTHHYHHVATTEDHTNERIIYPKPANETKLVPSNPHPNGHAPYVPATYKYSETTYSALNTTERLGGGGGGGTFPRPVTPSPGDQQPPKKLDDLLADFPEARFPTHDEGPVRRKVEVSQASRQEMRNTPGPAVYYPPGHTPFQKKDAPVSAAYQASAMQGGGAYASGKGMYEYESGSKSKEKHSEKKTAVPVCLPLCCAMPCVIM